MKYLEIAGHHKRNKNWDVIRDRRIDGGILHDMTNLPIHSIKDETYDGVYSEHFIEHLTRREGIAFFFEMFRIMKKGATIRTVWPPMDIIDKLNSNQDLEKDDFVVTYHDCFFNNDLDMLKHPFYKTILDNDTLANLSKQKKVALRLLHQEGEHKHLWYIQEMIDCLMDIGFTNVRQMQYDDSTVTEFKYIDYDNVLRAQHSAVVEATK